MTKFANLYQLDEEQRIALIGETAMAGKTVAFMVDDDGKKADRYVAKLREKFPGIVVHVRRKGPVAGVLTVKVGPPGSARH